MTIRADGHMAFARQSPSGSTGKYHSLMSLYFPYATALCWWNA